MADYRGVNYLRRRLQIKSERVKMRDYEEKSVNMIFYDKNGR